MTHSELVFALVAPVGIDYQAVYEVIEAELRLFGMETRSIRLSSEIPVLGEQLGVPVSLPHDHDEFRRINASMKEANKLEEVFNERLASCDGLGVTEENSLFAIAACRDIHNVRQTREAGAISNESSSLSNIAHVLLTLKRPEEIKVLRAVYGAGFHLFGIYSSRQQRFSFLTRRKHISEEHARQLIRDDEDDRESGGQRTSKAFHLSDLFVDIDNENWGAQVKRYLQLLFSHPYISPTRDEQSMYMAFAASIRSAQLGRQVGSSISTEDGDLLAIGCNEVPRPNGGQYWGGDNPDERDHQLGADSNDKTKALILEELIDALRLELSDYPQEGLESIRKRFRTTSLFQITEFGRAVHAEMEAILMCSRNGVSPKGAILYTTTFPCHNCARHIVGAGLSKVVYIEPYPKSKALELHSDAIRSDSNPYSSVPAGESISFVPYVGVSPQRYAELFMVNPVYGRPIERKKDGTTVDWRHRTAEMKLPMKPISYLERERVAVADFVLIQSTAGLGKEGDDGRGNCEEA